MPNKSVHLTTACLQFLLDVKDIVWAAAGDPKALCRPRVSMFPIRLHFELNDLSFEKRGDGTSLAIFTGHVSADDQGHRFAMKLSMLESGEWKLESLAWEKAPPPLFESIELYQKLTNKAAQLLYPVHIWPGEQGESGGKVVANQKIPPPDERENVCLAWRPDVLAVSAVQWDQIWKRIEDRVRADPCFWVQGMSDNQVLEALGELRQIFPHECVSARFRDVAGPSAGPGAPFPQNHPAWFPASHIARTAVGALCVDPAWNYLVEIGQARRQLRGVPGLDRVDRQLARSAGCRHQLCMAAQLHQRGVLLEIEPNSGSGHNDLAVRGSSQVYEVEVKELTTAEPAERLKHEIDIKARKVPAQPARAVVMHVVLADGEGHPGTLEANFVQTAGSLGPDLPARISALVIGRCFVDSTGGTVKRDTVSIVLNPNAVRRIDADDLAQLVRKNYDWVVFPRLGFGKFVDTQSTSSG